MFVPASTKAKISGSTEGKREPSQTHQIKDAPAGLCGISKINFNGRFDRTGHCTRSLTSMLADPRTVSAPDANETVGPEEERELEGGSKFIALDEGWAPFFLGNGIIATLATTNEHNNTHNIVADLFPTGFSSSSADETPPAATAAAKHPDGVITTKSILERKEPVLLAPGAVTLFSPNCLVADFVSEGQARQLLPSPVNAKERTRHQRSSFLIPPLEPSLASSPQQVGHPDLRQHLLCHQPNTNPKVGERSPSIAEPTGWASPKGTTCVAGRPAVVAEVDSAVKKSEKSLTFKSGGSQGATAQPSSTTREREYDLSHALDRLVPRLHQSEQRVTFLEACLEQAKQAESGRNALIKQVTSLDEETKLLRHRLEMRHTEALESRERRRSLEADNARLSAELRSASGQISRLETETRRKDALLAEARDGADVQSRQILTLQIELRHKDQLLEEAERDKKRAWQTTNASAETAKVAIMRAEAAVNEASDIRTKVHVERQPERQRDQSLADVVAAAAAAPNRGGPEDIRRAWVGGGSDLLQTWPQAGRDPSKRRARSLSFERACSVEHTEPTAADSIAGNANHKYRRRSAADINTSTVASRNIPPRAVATTTSYPSLRGVFLHRKDGTTWGMDIDESSPLSVPQERSGSERRMPTIIEIASPLNRATGRELWDEGDRQRHDSEGVKRALTGANPAWTDVPSLSGGGSPKVTEGCGDSENCALGRRLLEGGSTGSAIGIIPKAYRARREDRGEICGGHAIDEVGLSAEEHARTDVGDDAPRGDVLLRVYYPAAGHKRGRDLMSSRRSSLSGAGVGVIAVTGEGYETCQVEPGSAPEARHVLAANGTQNIIANSDAFDERQVTTNGSAEREVSPSTAASISLAAANDGSSTACTTKVSELGRRQSSTQNPPARVSTVSLASLVGNNDSCGVSDKEGGLRRTVSAPFATDAEEDELRPVREMERRLMLLQMEVSQLEAEQNKLRPKASKTMQARVQMREIDSRLALLATESFTLRRIIREKPWRM